MAMASNRKKGDYSVLSEVNTEEEWTNLLERKGLVVVDVYSEWSGPCSAMTNFLKKIKLEVNDDLLHYAMAKSDTIPQLEVFRGQCKPTWLFMSGGEPVAVMHGANAPLLQKMIEKEIRKERQVLKGEAVRDTIELKDAVPQSSKKTILNLLADTDEEDSDGDGANDQNEDDDDSQHNFTILAIEPYIFEDDQVFLLLKEILEQEGFSVFQEREIVLTLDDIKFLTSGTKTTEDQMDLIVTKLLELQVKIFMLRADEGVKASKRMNEMLGKMFPEEAEPGKAKTAKDVLKESDSGDISFPEGLRTFFETRDNEKQPGLLCPDYAGFLGITEKHFYDSLTSVLDDPNVDCSDEATKPNETKNDENTETNGHVEEAATKEAEEEPQNDEEITDKPDEEKEASDETEAAEEAEVNADVTEAEANEATDVNEGDAEVVEASQEEVEQQSLAEIDDADNDRKALLVFPDDTKEFIQNEIDNFQELPIKSMGTCSTKLNKAKAELLIKKRRKIKEISTDEEHKLLVELSHMDAYATIIKRETSKENRDKQNAFIKELDPLIFTLHLGSMKIFFQNIETEEKTVDGEVLGELDQGYSSGEEEPPD